MLCLDETWRGELHRGLRSEKGWVVCLVGGELETAVAIAGGDRCDLAFAITFTPPLPFPPFFPVELTYHTLDIGFY